MSNELLPCPFCGSPAEEYPDGDMEGYSVMCSGKNKLVINDQVVPCPQYTFGYVMRETSIQAWNMRANKQYTPWQVYTQFLKGV